MTPHEDKPLHLISRFTSSLLHAAKGALRLHRSRIHPITQGLSVAAVTHRLTQASSSLLIAVTRCSAEQASLARSANKLASSLPPPTLKKAVWKGRGAGGHSDTDGNKTQKWRHKASAERHRERKPKVSAALRQSRSRVTGAGNPSSHPSEATGSRHIFKWPLKAAQ